MPADSTRLSRSSDFTRTLDKGVRVSARDVLISVAPLPRHWPDDSGIRLDVASAGGPRLGLIVSKKVGNAVTRHAVARRLRHAFAQSSASLPDREAMVVVRAKPSIVGASSTDLAKQLQTSFTHRRVSAAFSDAGVVVDPDSSPSDAR